MNKTCTKCKATFGSTFALLEHLRLPCDYVVKEPAKQARRPRKQPKTQGIEWLYYSLAAFNGTKYADHSSPNNLYISYVEYKAKKGKIEAAELAVQHKDRCLEWADSWVRSPNRRPWEPI